MLVRRVGDLLGSLKRLAFFRCLICMKFTFVECLFPVCPDGFTTCGGEDFCLENFRICDRSVDCIDASDESVCGERCDTSVLDTFIVFFVLMY